MPKITKTDRFFGRWLRHLFRAHISRQIRSAKVRTILIVFFQNHKNREKARFWGPAKSHNVALIDQCLKSLFSFCAIFGFFKILPKLHATENFGRKLPILHSDNLLKRSVTRFPKITKAPQRCHAPNWTLAGLANTRKIAKISLLQT